MWILICIYCHCVIDGVHFKPVIPWASYKTYLFLNILLLWKIVRRALLCLFFLFFFIRTCKYMAFYCSSTFFSRLSDVIRYLISIGEKSRRTIKGILIYIIILYIWKRVKKRGKRAWEKQILEFSHFKYRLRFQS